MKRYMIVAAIVAFVFSFSSLVLAQGEENIEYSWGTVARVGSNDIAVNEYDYEKDAEVAITYTIDSKTEIKDVASLQDIAVGDSVEIEFVASGEKRIVKIITVEKATKEEETIPPETSQEPPIKGQLPQEEVMPPVQQEGAVMPAEVPAVQPENLPEVTD